MHDSRISNDRAPAHRSSAALARASLFKFVAVLTAVFLLAGYTLVYLAHDLDRTEERESAFYTRKALHGLEKSLRLTVKDYAFWGDAYRHLHLRIDTDWAYVQDNIGATLYKDFGFQGVFVVNPANRTVYSVIDGKNTTIDVTRWLNQPIDSLLDVARARAQAETPVTAFVDAGGIPAVVGAAAITPGTDPTVAVHGKTPSVLLFVTRLDPSRLEIIGKDYGIHDLHVVSRNDAPADSVYALGENGAAGTLQWSPLKPGERLLTLALPLLGIAGLCVGLMTWFILRRATADAEALDAGYTSLQISESALATSEARFRDVVEASSDWVWEIDCDWRFTYLSQRFEKVTGLSRGEWIGALVDDLLRIESGTLSHWLGNPERRPGMTLQCSYADSEGRSRITRLAAREINGLGFRGTSTDVTEEVQAQRRIEFLSRHDALTGLPNRTRLREFLDGKLSGPLNPEHPLAMLSLDLDRFKPVNDLLGHGAGDSVLNEVSRRLSDCVRHGDLVARVGGDEFVLILSDVSSQEEVEALCARVIATIEQPIRIDEQDVFVGASVGIAMAPADASVPAELLRYADIALYEAKAGGRNTWRFYAGEMNSRIIERRRLESDLRFAIKHGELRLHFQPRYRLSDGQMVGAEALVRWQHPERGLVPPDTFIGIAEESGLIVALSDWVLEAACRHAVRWPEHLFVSINLSPVEFKRGYLVMRVRDALGASAIDPRRVELEITESAMLEDADSALEMMNGLKALGVRIAMDDFGTGYSSLSYLHKFPFDGLKVDRSFVNRLQDSADDKAIIQAIVDLGRALSLKVTAEGIETAEHLALLQAVRCDEGQGYFLSRPIRGSDFDALVAGSPVALT